MGQYFLFICILNETFIQFIETFRHEGGSKFLDMASINNYYMLRMEKLLSPTGLWFKQRVILAGEYAKKETPYAANLYELSVGCNMGVTAQNINPTVSEDDCIEEYSAKNNEFRYIINHDTKQYVDKQKSVKKIHPLAILLEEGYMESSGIWSRQRLSVENDIPDNYTEYIVDETEYEIQN